MVGWTAQVPVVMFALQMVASFGNVSVAKSFQHSEKVTHSIWMITIDVYVNIVDFHYLLVLNASYNLSNFSLFQLIGMAFCPTLDTNVIVFALCSILNSVSW